MAPLKPPDSSGKLPEFSLTNPTLLIPLENCQSSPYILFKFSNVFFFFSLLQTATKAQKLTAIWSWVVHLSIFNVKYIKLAIYFVLVGENCSIVYCISCYGPWNQCHLRVLDAKKVMCNFLGINEYEIQYIFCWIFHSLILLH